MYRDCCCAEQWGQMKRKRQGSSSNGRKHRAVGGCRLCEELGWREQQEEEMSDSGRWRRGLRLPNWIPEALELTPPCTRKKHTHVYTNRMRVGRQSYAGCSNEWVVQHRDNALRWPLSCMAPLSSNGQIHQLQLHKPQWNIQFLWKQMWVILHKSLQRVKYSCSCDVSLSNGHVNSCITAVIGMMWWQKHKIHFPYMILNLSSCSVQHFFSANRCSLLILSSQHQNSCFVIWNKP